MFKDRPASIDLIDWDHVLIKYFLLKILIRWTIPISTYIKVAKRRNIPSAWEKTSRYMIRTMANWSLNEAIFAFCVIPMSQVIGLLVHSVIDLLIYMKN